MIFGRKSGCLNNFNKEEIQKYFGESEESLKVCNKCSNFVYEDGLVRCKLDGDDKLNKRGK